jgi:hypothetical protein
MMKKHVSVILLFALVLAAMLTVVCIKADFNNPLDEKGKNFLEGNQSVEKDVALDTNENCVAAYFTNPALRCDKTPPELTLKGAQSVTIYNDNPGQVELNRLMGQSSGSGGWNDVVEWKEENVSVTAKLTRGGTTEVPYSPNAMPDPGNYIIVYTAVKTSKCEGVVIKPTDKPRGLLILEFVGVDDRLPSVTLRGQTKVDVDIGDSYTEPSGITVRDGDGTTEIPLTSIEIRDSRDNLVINITTGTSTQDKLANLSTELLKLNNRKATYTIIYNVTSPTNGKTASSQRTVEFVEKTVVGLPVPVIVLNTYSHSKVVNGKTIEHTDTALVSGGTYREIGVKEAYYMKDGQKIDIKSSVIIPTVSSSQTSSPRQFNVTYRVEPSANNYQAATTNRYVYVWDRDCEEDFTPPTITWNDGLGDALTLKLSDGGTWNYIISWSATNNDEALTAARKYLVDLGGMERLEKSGDGSSSNRAVLKAGTFTVTYVALGGCGGITVKTRTVIVTPVGRAGVPVAGAAPRGGAASRLAAVLSARGAAWRGLQ